MKLNKKIEQQRKKLRLSRREISEELKINKDRYTYFEQGRTHPRPEEIVKLADYFGITTDDLLGVKTWRSIEKDPPTEWGWYLIKKKGSRQSEKIVHDTNQFLGDIKDCDLWFKIPK